MATKKKNKKTKVGKLIKKVGKAIKDNHSKPSKGSGPIHARRKR